MKTRIATFLIAAGLALAQNPAPRPGPAGRQPAHPVPPPADRVKSYLGLTDAQMQAIARIHQQPLSINQETMTALRQKEDALHNLLRQSNPDAAAVGKAVLEVEALRKKARQPEMARNEEIRKQLNAEQKAKLKTLADAAALQPTIGQARALGLIDPEPRPAAGPQGPGGRPGMGPAGRHAVGPRPMAPVGPGPQGMGVRRWQRGFQPQGPRFQGPMAAPPGGFQPGAGVPGVPPGPPAPLGPPHELEEEEGN